MRFASQRRASALLPQITSDLLLSEACRQHLSPRRGAKVRISTRDTTIGVAGACGAVTTRPPQTPAPRPSTSGGANDCLAHEGKAVGAAELLIAVLRRLLERPEPADFGTNPLPLRFSLHNATSERGEIYRNACGAAPSDAAGWLVADWLPPAEAQLFDNDRCSTDQAATEPG